MTVEVAPDFLISHYRLIGSLGSGGMGEGTVLPTDKLSLATMVRVLLELGRVDEARPLVTHLQTIGYRHPTFVRAIVGTTRSGRAHPAVDRQ
jgi:hypothetical protein